MRIRKLKPESYETIIFTIIIVNLIQWSYSMSQRLALVHGLVILAIFLIAVYKINKAEKGEATLIKPWLLPSMALFFFMIVMIFLLYVNQLNKGILVLWIISIINKVDIFLKLQQQRQELLLANFRSSIRIFENTPSHCEVPILFKN